MEKYRIEVGKKDGVRAGNIVGAIANEGGIDSKNIGSIEILKNFSIVNLPIDMSSKTFKLLSKTKIVGKQLEISKVNS